MKRVVVAALVVVASFACTPEEPATAPPQPSGEPGVVNLIDDDPDNEVGKDPDKVPGADVEYGKYAPGSR